MPIVSIIVPVYGAEKYLRRLLDSIQAQTLMDFEAILIDDGSKDNSGKICDDYAIKDSRFRVIHKINEGVSIARQTGLNEAKGKYVIHADPDDWAEPNWLEVLFKKIEEDKTDMVICDFERIFTDRRVHYVQCPSSLHRDDIIEDMLNEKIWGCSWNKLIKKECFNHYSISFNPNMNLWEDLYVMCLLVAKGAKVSYVPRILYHYDSVINENGIVMHRNESHIQSVMTFIDELSPILSDKRFDEGWFHVKSKVKEWIFTVKGCKFDIKGTYGEINERYIKEAKKMPFSSRQRGVAICLQTNPLIGHFVYSSITHIKRILNLLRH